MDTLLAPDFLLSQDNIVVQLEYRVLLFGFLNLGFGEYTGNMGVKDQQLGLKWIYENIENFSGKKDEIMLFGGSAGTCFGCTKIIQLAEELMWEIAEFQVLSMSMRTH